MQLWTIHKSIPAEKNESNSKKRTDPEENMKKANVYYVQCKEMLPKCTYFKLHDPVAHKYNSTLEYTHDHVKRKIILGKNNINTLNIAC